MKKNIILLTISACALFACQKNEIELLEKPIIEQIGGNTYSYTFSATISDNVSEVDEDGTKATVSRAGAYTWAVNDELKFFKSDGASANAKITAVDGSNATITVTTTDPRADFVSAIYPASAAIAKDQISFNARGPIVVSAVSGGTLAFHHIGSVINLRFTEIPAGTANLVFTPEASLGFDGKFSFEGRVPSLTSGASPASIVVPATTADEGKDITISVPSIALTDGFTVTLKNDSGRNLFKKTTEKTLDLSGGHKLLNMKKVACEAPKMFFMKITSTTKFWDSDSELLPMIKTGASEYTLFANSDYDATYKIVDEYNIDNFENGALYSGSTTGQEVYENSCLIIGNHTDPEWSLTKGTSMNSVWNWCFARNVTTLSNKYFKFNYTSNTSDYSKVYSTNNGSDYWLGIDGSDTNFGQGDGKKAYFLNTSDPVDIYFHPSEGVFVKAAGAKDGKICAVFKYVLDTSKGVDPVSVTWSSSPSLKAFADDFPASTYFVQGAWDGWKHHSTTYSNLSFTSDEITIESSNTYGFGLGEGAFWMALKDSRGTINPGTNLYGTLTYYDDSKTDASVTLEAGKYIVYANATNIDGKLNVMFVKQ